ncbi:AAA family ATPase [Bradyrhizobium sp. 33ap4]|uniref:AAA family ATPase n=1 Tax=Bradyrhizobium sp. 33ap4 TaxID=3061630 RepID=UPI00292CE05E|nr:AAA family ATPase [Bradyrhizobium sp. 33ap4]
MPATFDDFWRLGYTTRLIPIVPPNAKISERSTLHKRVGTKQDGRGKTPGVCGADGLWFSYDWLRAETAQSDLARWARMGAGIGCRMGDGLAAIDADTLDKRLASIIQQAVTQHVGVPPCRIGNFPKALYLVRVSGPMPYKRVEFGDNERVEILTEGRQAVFHGIHPKTGAPYTWPFPLVPFDQLPVVTPEQLAAFLEDLRQMLPAAKAVITEGAGNEVSQASLRGDIETVRKAVAATPNTSEAFPTRETWRDFGYAIKAALPDNEAEAFEIFSEWSARWTEGGKPAEPGNDPGYLEAEWKRFKGPFRRGAGWLFELAEQHNPDSFKRVDAWFTEIPDEPESLFIENSTRLLEDPQQPVAIKWVDPIEWNGATPPKRKWRITGMVPDGEVTLLTGTGGVGKTLLAQQGGTAVSQGLPFLGRETERCKVMMFLCEDSEDELNLRQRDINASMGLDMADVSPWLRIASRKYMDNLLAIWNRNTGEMKRTAVWKALRDDAVAFGAKLLIVDTIADTFGGSEIDRTQVRQFVQACLGRLAEEIGGAVMALGHPSKSGEAAGGDGTSGSTAWHASVRSRLYLQHAAKDRTGPFRRLENRKANYGASGDVFMLRWARGAFALESAKSGELLDDVADDSAGAGLPVKSMGNVIDDAILAAVERLAAEGVPLSKASNSPHWAPRVFKRNDDALGVYLMDEIEAGWQRVLTAGRVAVAVVGRKAHNRMPIVGFKVVQVESAEEPENVFG